MFSFRRKPKKEDTPLIRTSPSLPELNSQGIPWPENLVDVDALRRLPPPDSPLQGATKASFGGIDHVPILFHKPFRASPGKLNGGEAISSLYITSPPSAFEKYENRRSNTPTTGRFSHRRARIPPTFNLMVSSSVSSKIHCLCLSDEHRRLLVAKEQERRPCCVFSSRLPTFLQRLRLINELYWSSSFDVERKRRPRSRRHVSKYASRGLTGFCFL